MPATDILNMYFDKKAVTGTTPYDETDGAYVDHVTLLGRGPGPSRGIYLEIINHEVWVGNDTSAPVFTFEQDADTAFSDPTILATFTASATLIPALEVIARVALPTVTARYTRVQVTWAGTASAGSFSAYLTDSPDGHYVGR